MRTVFATILVSVFFEADLFTAEAGMPQLDPKYWASQAFWLVIVFLFLYILSSRIFIPKIKNSLDNRDRKIKDDLDEAKNSKNLSEKKLKEYETLVENAKKEVQKILPCPAMPPMPRHAPHAPPCPGLAGGCGDHVA